MKVGTLKDVPLMIGKKLNTTEKTTLKLNLSSPHVLLLNEEVATDVVYSSLCDQLMGNMFY